MKKMESSKFESVENSFKQKVNDQNSACSLTYHNNVRVSGVGIHSSDRSNFNGHVLAKLKDNVLGFERICNNITISPVFIILVDKFHESGNEVSVSAVEEDEIASKSSFLSSVEEFRDLDFLENGWHFLILVLPQQTVSLLSTRNKVLIVLMPLKLSDFITMSPQMVSDG